MQADELQYELKQGACYQAVLSDPVVQVEDLASDLRWPEYGPKATAAFGLGSQLAYQFRAEPHARGALNLYANEPCQIDVDARMLGGMFAQMVSVAMVWSRQNESLREAMATRETIGHAMGILMERYQLDSDRAFAFWYGFPKRAISRCEMSPPE